MADYKFPTEVVDLPSKGYFYIDGHPLSSGKVEVKYMTAKEEDILTSQNLIQQGTVIDILLQALIVDKTINIHDLLVGDKNAIMVAARVPTSERTITFKLLSGQDERKIDAELKALEKISKSRSSELTTRLKTMLLSVDGNSEKEYIINFVENEFLSRDSLAFRKHLSTITPDMDMTTTIVDSSGKETEVTIPVTVRFFWPSSGV